jgi:hypothetical protein
MFSGKDRSARRRADYILGVCLIVLSVLTGGLLTYLGVGKLSYPWWDNESFLVNMASALVGALFGIPFAIIILYRVAASQASRSEWKLTRRLVVQTVDDLLEIVGPILVGDDSGDVISKSLSMLDEALRSTNSLLEHLAPVYPDTGEFPPDGLDYDFREAAKTASDALFRAQGWVDELATMACGSPRVSKLLENRWQFFDTYVRARISEAGRAWVSNDVYLDIDIVVRYGADLSAVRDIAQYSILEQVGRMIEDWRTSAVLDKFGLTQIRGIDTLNSARGEAVIMLALRRLPKALKAYVESLR